VRLGCVRLGWGGSFAGLGPDALASPDDSKDGTPKMLADGAGGEDAEWTIIGSMTTGPLGMLLGLSDAAGGIAGGGIGPPRVWLGGSFVWTGLRLAPQSRQNRKESSFSRPQFLHLIIALASQTKSGRGIWWNDNY
jgi:hypothetical protein